MPVSTSSLRKIFSYGTASSATVAALFLLHIIAGRLLGVEDYGRFSFALAFVGIFAPVLDLGLHHLLVREISRDHAVGERYIGHALTWKIVAGPVVLTIALFAVRIIHESEVVFDAVALLAAAQVLRSVKSILRPTFLARERFGLDALSLGIERFSLLLIASLILLSGGGVVALCWAFFLAQALDLVVTIGIVRRFVSLSVGTDFAFLRNVLAAAIPIGGLYVTLVVYNYADTVIVSWLRGDAEVGWYSAAYRLYDGPMLIPAIVGTVFMPRLSKLFVEDRGQFTGVMREGLVWVLLAAVGVAGIGVPAAGWLVTTTYGSEFDASTSALRVLLLGVPFAFVINFLKTGMISMDRQKAMFLVAMAGLAANIGLNLVLVPLWGFLGAAWATVVIEAGVCATLAIYVVRALRDPSFNRLPAERGSSGGTE